MPAFLTSRTPFKRQATGTIAAVESRTLPPLLCGRICFAAFTPYKPCPVGGEWRRETCIGRIIHLDTSKSNHLPAHRGYTCGIAFLKNHCFVNLYSWGVASSRQSEPNIPKYVEIWCIQLSLQPGGLVAYCRPTNISAGNQHTGWLVWLRHRKQHPNTIQYSHFFFTVQLKILHRKWCFFGKPSLREGVGPPSVVYGHSCPCAMVSGVTIPSTLWVGISAETNAQIVVPTPKILPEHRYFTVLSLEPN